MDKTNLLFYVESAEQADFICAICAKYFDSARVSSIGLLNDSYKNAPCVITCTCAERVEGRKSYIDTLNEIRSYGLHRCIA